MTFEFQESKFTSWGRVTHEPQRVARPQYRQDLAHLLSQQTSSAGILAVGLGRSYGDTVLNAGGRLIDMTALDRVISLDLQAGVLRAEAGLSIDAALRIIVPQGWFLGTTPGTRFVTLGGAVANDVHGKNHHAAGSFGCSVRRMGLLRSYGTEIEISPADNKELFNATIGGLGLTGVITWVEIDLVRIPSATLTVERLPFDDLAGFFKLADASASTHEHTVAWIDCASDGAAFGRGIFQRANWAENAAKIPHPEGLRATVPFEAPSMALNRYSVRAFNSFYWRIQKSGPSISNQHYGSFLYPLDAIGRWNLMYGRRGFFQYQCVIPQATSESAVAGLLKQIVRAGAGSFLAVLKTFGPKRSPGLLSFPRQGATLALDFPNRGAMTLDLMATLDKVVSDAGGRLYPAKDGRMPAGIFRTGYGENLEAFAHAVDPAFASDFWRRVSA